jgi:hypothetical protein
MKCEFLELRSWSCDPATEDYWLSIGVPFERAADVG